MNLSYYFARRYLISRKSQNIINIISGISVLGVTIGTAALIIVLSVFNGFEQVVTSLYNSFDPDLKIILKEGKTFDHNDISTESLKAIKGVQYVVEVLEENALVKYRDKQYIATIKGVNPDFVKMTGVDTMITEGTMLLEKGDTNYAVVGQGVAYFLSLNVSQYPGLNFLNIYVPKRGVISTVNPEDAFNQRRVIPAGIFSIQQDFDEKYVLIPLHFARELLDYTNEVTALEIGLMADADHALVQREIKKLIGAKYEVQSRYQQHELLYKIMKSEKWAVYLILTFILLIATVNIIGSLTMLIIEKKKDIVVLHSLGADADTIRRIFLVEGMLITFVGAAIGIFLGFAVGWAQQHFNIIPLQGSGTFVIQSYPIDMQLQDFIYVFLTVLVIGFLAAWYPARQLLKKGKS